MSISSFSTSQATPDWESSRNLHFYGAESAVTVEPEAHRDMSHTIAIDAAPKRGKQVLWDQKIRFQVTSEELPVLACVLAGLAPEIEFKFHGEARNKSLHVMRRGNGVLVKVSQGPKSFTVPLPAGQAFKFAMLVQEQLGKTYDGVDGHIVMAHLRSIAAFLPKKQEC